MRIWDQVPADSLCRQHLLAQWRESLGLWNILTQGKKGYSNHPETKRWRGFERALWNTMSKTRSEMILRGWNPKPLPVYPFFVLAQKRAFPEDVEFGSWPKPWDDQVSILKAKGCSCKVTR